MVFAAYVLENAILVLPEIGHLHRIFTGGGGGGGAEGEGWARLSHRLKNRYKLL